MQQRLLNRELAIMVHFAVFDPKKIPDPRDGPEKKPEDLTEEEGAQGMRAFFSGLMNAQANRKAE